MKNNYSSFSHFTVFFSALSRFDEALSRNRAQPHALRACFMPVFTHCPSLLSGHFRKNRHFRTAR